MFQYTQHHGMIDPPERDYEADLEAEREHRQEQRDEEEREREFAGMEVDEWD